MLTRTQGKTAGQTGKKWAQPQGQQDAGADGERDDLNSSIVDSGGHFW
jgi:hypothetical protein